MYDLRYGNYVRASNFLNSFVSLSILSGRQWWALSPLLCTMAMRLVRVTSLAKRCQTEVIVSLELAVIGES
jgi:hypothetical protein